MASIFSRTPGRRITRITRGLFMSFCCALILYLLFESFSYPSQIEFKYIPIPIRPERFPVSKPLHLPHGRPRQLPQIQHELVLEKPEIKALRESRLEDVRDTFLHAWNGYKAQAWGEDELRPIAGGFKTPFCGWAATLVDTLDTLWIMELYDEFELALEELKTIDFTNTEGCRINLFETTIRHLGGLLAAFDISGGKRYILVQKAVELAEVLITAFDTPNRMPNAHYVWSAINPEANDHMPSRSVVVAVLGSLSLEFTRLSQITGNEKYYDGIQRVMNEMEKWQMNTTLPGMWPAMVDASMVNRSVAIGSPFDNTDELFTLGSLADSAYEYLPKEYMMLGGLSKTYRTMYESFVSVAKKHLFFRPMTIGNKDILISGSVNMFPGGKPRLSPDLQHLTCFAGGMLAIAGKIFNRPDDVEDGRRLADGCVWAYRNTITGIMPEAFTAVPCPNNTACTWDEKAWYKAIDPNADPEMIRERINAQQLSPGFTHILDKRYLLRPEAIESVFILWRITNDPYWTEAGWEMFTAIQAHCKTELAHSAIDNVMNPAPRKVDEMESFWLAETLKYFYLLYSETSVVSLDEYVLNTEAHPLRRPR